jgi:hypothetical protein
LFWRKFGKAAKVEGRSPESAIESSCGVYQKLP